MNGSTPVSIKKLVRTSSMFEVEDEVGFQGGSSRGGAPSSLASPEEGLEWMLSLTRDAHAQSQHQEESNGDEEQLASKLAEAQLRTLVDSEMASCLLIHDALEFWSERLSRPWAGARLWIERGPWLGSGPRGALAFAENNVLRLTQLMHNKVSRVGHIQRHLTMMRGAYSGGGLRQWSADALLMGFELTGSPPLLVGDSPSSSCTESSGSPLLESIKDSTQTVRAYVGGMSLRTYAEMGECVPPHKLRRNWVQCCLTSAACLWAWHYKAVGFNLLLLAKESLQVFFREHVQEPLLAIFEELFQNRRNLPMADEMELKETQNELNRMLLGLVHDRYPNLSEEEARAEMKRLGMTAASLENISVKHVFTGDLARILLIQTQFVKKELLVALTAIEELARENDMNLRMFATIPAFLLAWVTYRLLQPVYNALTRRKSRSSVRTAMKILVQTMERLLNLRNCPAAPSCTYHEMQILDDQDLGRLTLLVYQLRRLLRPTQRHWVIQAEFLAGMQEDLAELMCERGIVSIEQQLQIVQRMQRTYACFQRTPQFWVGGL